MSEAALDLTNGSWVRACAVDEVAPGEATVVAVEPPIAVFNVDGEFFATDDICTHDLSSLADGYIDGDIVECAFHFAKFSIKEGTALTPPAFGSLRTWEVRVSDGAVYVNITGHESA